MKVSFRSGLIVAGVLVMTAFAMPQDGLGKRRGGGGSGGGSNSGGGGGGNSNNNSGGGGNRGGSGAGNEARERGNRGGGNNNRGGGNSNGGFGGTAPGGGGYNGGGLGRGGNTNPLFGNGSNDRRSDSTFRRSRSGTVRYGSTNNTTFRRDDFQWNRAPRGSSGVIERRLRQQGNRVGTVSGYYDGYRTGYYHYDRRWRDDNFCYPYYVFSPWQYDRFACSPWYYYVSLPPYILTTRIIYVNNYVGYTYSNWDNYSYRRWDRFDDNYDREARREDLDYALRDITDAYERNDRRAVDRLIPRNGAVAIFMDGNYQYSLNTDDFYDLLMDGIQSTRTRSYDITDVRRSGDVARITARHEYEDPWGNRESVYHYYTLQLEGRRDYVIREFGTERR